MSLADATRGGEDDFSWEDDDDEVPPSTTSTNPPVASALPRTLSNPAVQVLNSPRLSSEASYDLVGDGSVAGTRGQSPNVSPVPVPAEEKAPVAPKEKAPSDDGDDSDWE